MTELRQDRVVCRHDERMDGLIGTCRHCGQQKDYGTIVNKKPKLIKRGRLNGILTVVVPPNLSQEEAPVPPPSPPTEETVPVPVPTRPASKSDMNQYYEDNKEAILRDYHSLGQGAMLKRWGIPHATWLPKKDGSRGGMAVRFGAFSPAGVMAVRSGASSPPVPVAPQPTSTKPAQLPKRRHQGTMHKYYEKNREAILEDLENLGPTEMREKWGIASSTWTYLRRRWTGEDSGRVKSTSPLVDETDQGVEQGYEDLVSVGARMEQRNAGRTGIRRIYSH